MDVAWPSGTVSPALRFRQRGSDVASARSGRCGRRWLGLPPVSVARGLLSTCQIYTRRMVGHSNDEEMISSRAPASRLAASKATRSMDPTVGTRERSTATGWSIDAPIVPRSAVPSRRRGTLDQALQTRLDRVVGDDQRFQTDPVGGMSGHWWDRAGVDIHAARCTHYRAETGL
jgi:hypothetical protein